MKTSTTRIREWLALFSPLCSRSCIAENQKLRRFSFKASLLGMAAAAGLVMSSGAQAAYPDKPIQVTLSFPPAGATDVLARAVSQQLSIELGQTFVVDNKPGAGGAIGLVTGARAEPNGYALYFAATTNQAIAAAIYSDQQAHLAKDFEPIGLIGSVPHALVVPATLPVKNATELLDYIKAAPGKYNFASQGVGTLSHLEGELFTTSNQLQITHVPYKGSSQALPDVVNGTAVMMFDSVTGSMPLASGGKLRYLAVVSDSRVSLLPDVPTLAESGVKTLIPNNRFGLFAPKGTPPEVIALLSEKLERALASPKLQKQMAAQGAQLNYGPPAELARVVEEEHKYWGDVVKSANISAK